MDYHRLSWTIISCNLVYRTTITKHDNDTSETQTGCTVEYKQRHKHHKESFENPDVKQTCLSQHIWKKLKATNPHIPYSIVWEEVDRAPPPTIHLWGVQTLPIGEIPY